MMEPWTVLGLGRCGLQLARAMNGCGVALAGAVGRSGRSRARARRLLPGIHVTGTRDPLPASRVLLISVPDDALGDVARDLAGRLPATVRVVLHTSGLHAASTLGALASPGRHLGSFHPLVPFPVAAGPAVRLAGATAGIEGDRVAVATARDLAHRLSMRPVRLDPEAKARYHAAATLAATLTHALVVAARQELTRAGVSPSAAQRAVGPLVRAAIEGALAARGWERLTGPLVRGDAATVAAHLRALSPALAGAYREVTRLALGGIEDAGLLGEEGARLTSRALTGRGFHVSVRAMVPHGGR